jgi:methionyl-tRNA formyltransferase
VTLHYIDTGIDSGDIIAQAAVPISREDTGKSLYDKCTQVGIELFRIELPGIISGEIRGRKQITTKATRYYKRDFPSREIDFSRPGEEIYNRIRAVLFDPFPPPYFYIGNSKYIITRAPNSDERRKT